MKSSTASSYSRRVDDLISSLNKNYKLINSAITKLTSKYKSNKIPKTEFLDTLKQCEIYEDPIVIDDCFLKYVSIIDSKDHQQTEKVDYQKFLLRLFNPPPLTPLSSKDYHQSSSQIPLQFKNQTKPSSTNTTSIASASLRASSTPMLYNSNSNNFNNHYNTCIQNTRSENYKGRNTEITHASSYNRGSYSTYSFSQTKINTSIPPQRIQTFWNQIFGLRYSYVGWRQFEASFISYFRKEMDPLILHNFLENLYNVMKTLSSSATQLSRNWLFSILIYSPLTQSEVQKRVTQICRDVEKKKEENCQKYRSKSQNKDRTESANTMYQSNYNFKSSSSSCIVDSGKFKRAVTNPKSSFVQLEYTHSKILPAKHLQNFKTLSEKLLLRENCKYLRHLAEYSTKICQRNDAKYKHASKVNCNSNTNNYRTHDSISRISITPTLTHNQSYDPQASVLYNNSVFDLNTKNTQQQFYESEEVNKKIFSENAVNQQTESSIEYVEDSYNDDEVYQELRQNCPEKPSNNLRQLDSQDGIKQFFKRLSKHTQDKILVQDQHKSPPPPPLQNQENRRRAQSTSAKKRRNPSLNSHYAKKYKMLKKRYAEVIYQRSMDRVHYDANINCMQNLQQKLKQTELQKLMNQNQIGELKAQVHQMSLALQNSHHLLAFIKFEQIALKQDFRKMITYFHGWRLNARSQTLHEEHCLAARNMIGVLKLHNKIIENRSRKNKLVIAFSKMSQSIKNIKLNQRDLLIQGSLLSSRFNTVRNGTNMKKGQSIKQQEDENRLCQIKDQQQLNNLLSVASVNHQNSILASQQGDKTTSYNNTTLFEYSNPSFNGTASNAYFISNRNVNIPGNLYSIRSPQQQSRMSKVMKKPKADKMISSSEFNSKNQLSQAMTQSKQKLLKPAITAFMILMRKFLQKQQARALNQIKSMKQGLLICKGKQSKKIEDDQDVQIMIQDNKILHYYSGISAGSDVAIINSHGSINQQTSQKLVTFDSNQYKSQSSYGNVFKRSEVRCQISKVENGLAMIEEVDKLFRARKFFRKMIQTVKQDKYFKMKVELAVNKLANTLDVKIKSEYQNFMRRFQRLIIQQAVDYYKGKVKSNVYDKQQQKFIQSPLIQRSRIRQLSKNQFEMMNKLPLETLSAVDNGSLATTDMCFTLRNSLSSRRLNNCASSHKYSGSQAQKQRVSSLGPDNFLGERSKGSRLEEHSMILALQRISYMQKLSAAREQVKSLRKYFSLWTKFSKESNYSENNQKLPLLDTNNNNPNQSLRVTLSSLRSIASRSNSALKNKVNSFQNRCPQSPPIMNSYCHPQNPFSPNPFQSNINICNISANSGDHEISDHHHNQNQNLSYNKEPLMMTQQNQYPVYEQQQQQQYRSISPILPDQNTAPSTFQNFNGMCCGNGTNTGNFSSGISSIRKQPYFYQPFSSHGKCNYQCQNSPPDLKFTQFSNNNYNTGSIHTFAQNSERNNGYFENSSKDDRKQSIVSVEECVSPGYNFETFSHNIGSSRQMSSFNYKNQFDISRTVPTQEQQEMMTMDCPSNYCKSWEGRRDQQQQQQQQFAERKYIDEMNRRVRGVKNNSQMENSNNLASSFVNSSKMMMMQDNESSNNWMKTSSKELQDAVAFIKDRLGIQSGN